MTAVSLRSRTLCVTAICLSLWSCASQKPPFKVAVACPQNYSGHIHVSLCQTASNPTAKLDEHGNGLSSACPAPGDNVEIYGTRGADGFGIVHQGFGVAEAIPGEPGGLDLKRGGGLPIVPLQGITRGRGGKRVGGGELVFVEHRHRVGYGSVYQGRYKSFALQDDAHFSTVVRYVERNPLR